MAAVILGAGDTAGVVGGRRWLMGLAPAHGNDDGSGRDSRAGRGVIGADGERSLAASNERGNGCGNAQRTPTVAKAMPAGPARASRARLTRRATPPATG